MTAAASTKIQLNFKTPQGTLINLYADNDTQLDAELDALEARVGRIVSIEQLVSGAATVQAAFAPANVTYQPAPNIVAPAAAVALPPVVAPQPAGVGPACQHGAMVFRESKPGSAKTWKAWMCPGPKGADQCEPQWIR